MQDALAAVENGELINRSKVFAELLIVQAVRDLTTSAFAGVIGVDCFLAERLIQLFERCRLFSAKEYGSVAVTDNCAPVLFIHLLELGKILSYD